MKKLVIASDSHGSAAALGRVVAGEPDADALIFLGDGLADLEAVQQQFPRLPVYAVAGNCDYGSSAPGEGLVQLDGVKLFFTHGHRFNVKNGLLNITLAAAQRCADAVLFGHTHLPLLDEYNGIALFNPGSVGRPVCGRATYGVAEIKDGSITFRHKEVPALWED